MFWNYSRWVSGGGVGNKVIIRLTQSSWAVAGTELGKNVQQMSDDLRGLEINFKLCAGQEKGWIWLEEGWEQIKRGWEQARKMW